MLPAPRLIILAVGAALLASPPATATSRTPAAAGSSLATRLCDALQGVPERRKSDCCATSASAGLAAACAGELAEPFRAGTIVAPSADVARCAADTAHALTGCDWVTPRLPPIPASCRGILRGTRVAGAGCRSSLECRDGLHCVAGVCAPPGIPGAACTGAPDALTTITRQTDDDETRHPECTGYCFRGRCAAPVAVGGDCSADRQCALGMHCAGHRCVDERRPQLGDACTADGCDHDLACIDGRCAPPKAVGESCREPSDCHATCLGATPTTPGTCATRCSDWPPAGYTPPVATATP